MTLERGKTLAIFLSGLLIMLAVGYVVSKQRGGRAFGQSDEKSSARKQDKGEDDEQAKRVFDHLVENIRYCRYWYGTPDIDDVYVEGKQISALIFWNKAGRKSRVGLCSAALSRCLATSGIQLSPVITQMRIDHDLTPRAAFESFVKNGIDGNAIIPTPHFDPPSTRELPPAPKAPPTGNSAPTIPTIPRDLAGRPFPVLERMSVTDFEFEEKSVTLPPLGLPSSISRRIIPAEARHEAEKIRKEYVCWYGDTKRPPGCSGTLVFAYYDETSPNWIVLRSCSSACTFQGDSIQFLRRWDDGSWETSGAGNMNSPKEEVARLKQKIEQAEMFRFQIP